MRTTGQARRSRVDEQSLQGVAHSEDRQDEKTRSDFSPSSAPEQMKSEKRKTANKICLWVIIAAALLAALATAFTGCEEEEALIREELYSVQVLGVTPDLIDGVEQRLAVSVEYNVQLSYIPHDLQLIIAFNTEAPDDFKVYGYTGEYSDYVSRNPSGTYTFDVALTPKDWSSLGGEFQAEAYIGYVEQRGSSYAVTGALISARKPFPVSDDYWTIAWHLNGGAKGSLNGQEAKHPARVAKGAVLAPPFPAPAAEDGTFFGGWYTDSALTQPYPFAAAVTTDLNLYAKWRELAPADLYGIWIGYNYSTSPHTLTITANSIELSDTCTVNGDHVRYSNVVWAGQPTATINANNTTNTDYPRGYAFTGTRTDVGGGHFTATYLGFVALSTDGQRVFLKQDAATNVAVGNMPWVYYK